MILAGQLKARAVAFRHFRVKRGASVETRKWVVACA
jgi:hypothetical protein